MGTTTQGFQVPAYGPYPAITLPISPGTQPYTLDPNSPLSGEIPPEMLPGAEAGGVPGAPAAPPPPAAPATTGGFGPAIPGGYTTDNPPSTPGWFYNSQTGQFEYSPGGGAAPTTTAPDSSGNQVPGLGAPLNSAGTAISNAIPKLSWIEEIAIRLAMVFVGIVLIFAGFYVAGKRARNPVDNPGVFVR
jgi:hypothetical protein